MTRLTLTALALLCLTCGPQPEWERVNELMEFIEVGPHVACGNLGDRIRCIACTPDENGEMVCHFDGAADIPEQQEHRLNNRIFRWAE